MTIFLCGCKAILNVRWLIFSYFSWSVCSFGFFVTNHPMHLVLARLLEKQITLINGSKPTQCNGRCSWLSGNHIIYYDGLHSLIIMIKIWLSLIKNSQKIIWFSYSFICIFCSLHSNLLPFWKPLEQRTAETLALQTLLSHLVIFHSVSPLVSLHPPIHPFISASLFLSSGCFVALHPWRTEN